VDEGLADSGYFFGPRTVLRYRAWLPPEDQGLRLGKAFRESIVQKIIVNFAPTPADHLVPRASRCSVLDGSLAKGASHGIRQDA